MRRLFIGTALFITFSASLFALELDFSEPTAETDQLYEEYTEDPSLSMQNSAKAGINPVTLLAPPEKLGVKNPPLKFEPGQRPYRLRITAYLGTGGFYNHPRVEDRLTYASSTIDYLMGGSFSVFAKAQVPITSVTIMRHRTTTLAAGSNIHFLRFGSLGLYLGGALGYTIIDIEQRPAEAMVLPLVQIGAHYDLEVFHYSIEYVAQAGGYENIDLSQGIVHFGLGVRL